MFIETGAKIYTELGGESTMIFTYSTRQLNAVTCTQNIHNKVTEVFTYHDGGDVKDTGTFYGSLQGKATIVTVNKSILSIIINNTQEENDGVYECDISGDSGVIKKTKQVETYSKYIILFRP